MKKQRQRWGSKIGIILAVAGSAIGLGNFIRFPVQAASNGGGAFIIPYFVALFLVGLPLMWIEWTAGRYGGGFGHGTAPGIFHTLSNKKRFIKYFGIMGIFGPIVIFSYYCYIESWLLGYTVSTLTPAYREAVAAGEPGSFFGGYIGLEKNSYFSSLLPAYIFFLITFGINFGVIFFGIRKGIERIAKTIMPILLVLGVVLAVRVLTLGAANAENPEWTIAKGLGFLWNPDLSQLTSAKVWLAATGQILFTLSVGIGVILTYASYLKEEDDVVLSGLTAASTNQFAEIVLGASIIIPAAFVFFGPERIVSIAQAGTFELGFVTMPMIFGQIPLGTLFAFCWFLLLFLAGITSSISLLQPAIAFLEDEFDISRKKAVIILAITTFVLIHPAIFFLGNGVVDELDFWGGTFSLVVFATFQCILFGWIFGIDKAWDEIHKGAQLRIPKIYKFIIKYITPAFLLTILTTWFIQDWIPIIRMESVPAENRPFIIGTRILLLAIFITLAVLVKISWKRKALKGGEK